MSVKGEKITITSSPTLIVSRGGTASVTKAVVIKSPSSAVSVWLGDNTVTGSGGGNEGFLFEAGDFLNIDLIDEDIYGIVASGSQGVYVLRSLKG